MFGPKVIAPSFDHEVATRPASESRRIFRTAGLVYPDIFDKGKASKWAVEKDRIQLSYNERFGLQVIWDGRGRIAEVNSESLGSAMKLFELCTKTKALIEKAGAELVGFYENQAVLRVGKQDWLVVDAHMDGMPTVMKFESTPIMLQSEDPRKVWEILGQIYWADWKEMGLTNPEDVELDTEIEDLSPTH